jgi:very-short-patch-repair endonuclease
MRRLRPIHVGVYAVGQQRLTQPGRHLAALLACEDAAALSHRSAAAAWDLRRWPNTVEITVPSRYHRHMNGVCVHATRSLLRRDVCIADGFHCTSVARTIVDLAAVASEAELERVLEQSLTLHLFDRNAVDDVLARSAGRHGIKRLRALMAELPDEPAPVNRELERLFLKLVRHARLPLPTVNGHIGGYQIDFHWPKQRLVVETDGRAHHDSPSAFERDRRRDLDLELAGWHVLRFGWRQVRDEPDRVAGLVRRRLRDRTPGG